MKREKPEPKKPSVYERIITASEKGKGIRLSEHEVHMLSMDDAIQCAAMNDAGENPYI